MTHAPLVLGIAGGSGSGKSTISRALIGALADADGVLLEQDHYYRKLSHLSYAERDRINYDHPDSLEFDLLYSQLEALRRGEAIDRPTYDFTTHDRSSTPRRIEPAPIIVVEGILVLSDAQLRKQFDVKIFVDTDADIRLMRRIRRDLEHRGRTFAQIRQQYYETVRPMHLAFVEPSKRFADVIIPEGGENKVAVEMLLSLVRAKIEKAR